MRLSLQLSLLLFLCICTRVPAQTVYSHDRQLPGMEHLTVDEALYPFYHGVASGDPLEDRVIIWTRVSPDSLGGTPVDGTWKVASDTELKNVVRQGTFTTDEARDYTVKVDVDGLQAGTTYYYGFTALDRNSLTGRTKTTPTGDVNQLRFGVVSCSNFQAGYFNAYGRLAERNDLDAVIHLGDYIYEYANFVYGNEEVWNDRLVEPDREIVSLFDYRTRYATYHLDEDLRHLHQQHPFIAVWDDHESANNSYRDGASNHQEGEGSWADRKDRSRQAYFEWMPIRDTGNRSIYRELSYGNLADLIMLDTRLEGRDKQITDVTDPALPSSDRTMLGQPQKDWLKQRLLASTAKWKLLGQQVIFSEFNVGWSSQLVGQTYEQVESEFLDIWDGYPAERRELTDFLREKQLDNVVLLAGDFHVSMAYEVADPPVTLSFREVEGVGRLPVYTPTDYDPATGEGAVAVEFATPSISAANFDETGPAFVAEILQRQLSQPLRPNDTLDLGVPNPHLKYADLTRHGYYVLDVREGAVQADYFFSPILERSATETFAAGLTSSAGTHQLRSIATAAAGKVVQDVPAPPNPPGLINAVRRQDLPRVLSLSPNPTRGSVDVQYAVPIAGEVTVAVLGLDGRTLKALPARQQAAGLYTFSLELGDLPAGSYLLRITSREGATLHRLIKQ